MNVASRHRYRLQAFGGKKSASKIRFKNPLQNPLQNPHQLWSGKFS
jgi:hypothetical protein